MRTAGVGPPFIKIWNKQIRYPVKDLDAWVMAMISKCCPTSGTSSDKAKEELEYKEREDE